ncbi:MAG TPA: hypothetical protein VLA82_07885 [Actinomycetota bacterium]|nr:hypothetical protein [Actinomycetota bacterium]
MLTRTGYAREQRSIDWGGVWAGLVWTIGLLVLLSSLWLALGFGGTNIAAFADNIEWWLAGTAILALLVGGIVAGWAPRARGVAAGLVNGMTVWGLLLTLSIIIGVPSLLGGAAIVGDTLQTADTVTDGGATSFPLDGNASLWATFWTALIGFATAAIGGMIGGNLPKRDEPIDTFDTRDDDRVRVGDDDRHRAYDDHRDDYADDADGSRFRGTTVPAHTHRDDDVVVVDEDARDRSSMMEHEHDGGYASRRR